MISVRKDEFRDLELVIEDEALAAIGAKLNAPLIGILDRRRLKHYATVIGTMRQALYEAHLMNQFRYKPATQNFLSRRHATER